MRTTDKFYSVEHTATKENDHYVIEHRTGLLEGKITAFHNILFFDPDTSASLRVADLTSIISLMVQIKENTPPPMP